MSCPGRWCVLCLLLAAGQLGQAMEWRPVGEARLQVLLWPIYISRLYSADGTYRHGQRPLRLEIEYLRDIPNENLVQRTAKEWQSQQLSHRNQRQWLDLLRVLWPDIRKGDRLALELDPQERARFYYNGQPLGEIADPAFGQQFLAIWLSPDASRPELRRALIGEAAP